MDIFPRDCSHTRRLKSVGLAPTAGVPLNVKVSKTWIDTTHRVFDRLEHAWQSPRTERGVATVVILLFLGALVGIELAMRGYLPIAVKSHFAAIDVVFTCLLFIEVLGLVFGLVGSVANAMGKQIEILSLIMLRQAFKRVAAFGEPLRWQEISEPVLYILSDGAGALVLFVMLGVYYRLQRHSPITSDPASKQSFVAIKQLIAMGLVVIFAGMGGYDLYRLLSGQGTYPFFESFYTVLVLADVLMVLVSLRYATDYAVVFRNSGFALATVLIRIALTAPPYFDALLGVAAAALALGLTWAYNRFGSIRPQALSPPPGGLDHTSAQG